MKRRISPARAHGDGLFPAYRVLRITSARRYGKPDSHRPRIDPVYGTNGLLNFSFIGCVDFGWLASCETKQSVAQREGSKRETNGSRFHDILSLGEGQVVGDFSPIPEQTRNRGRCNSTLLRNT